jgi:hypothetical protein
MKKRGIQPGKEERSGEMPQLFEEMKMRKVAPVTRFSVC